MSHIPLLAAALATGVPGIATAAGDAKNDIPEAVKVVLQQAKPSEFEVFKLVAPTKADPAKKYKGRFGIAWVVDRRPLKDTETRDELVRQLFGAVSPKPLEGVRGVLSHAYGIRATHGGATVEVAIGDPSFPAMHVYIDGQRVTVGTRLDDKAVWAALEMKFDAALGTVSQSP